MQKILSSLNHEHIYVPGTGNGAAKLMLVQDFPNKYEEAASQTLVGDGGKIANKMLLNAGTDRSQVYATSVVKVRPPDNQLRKLKDVGFTIDQFLPQLKDEITAIGPNCILVLGNLSLSVLTGKKKLGDWRGSILRGWNSFKVVPSFHPYDLSEYREGSGTFKYSSRVYMQLDFNRAVQESLTKTINLPFRNLRVCKSALQLHEFLQRNKAKKKVSVDIEVHKAIPICIGLAFSEIDGLSVPLINVDSERNHGINKSEQAQIWEMLAKFLEQEDLEIIGQNFHFDRMLIQDVLGIRIPDGTVKHELMFKCQTLHPEFPQI